jgi:hypothetical protein
MLGSWHVGWVGVGSFGFHSCFSCLDFVLGFGVVAGFAESLPVVEGVWVDALSDAFGVGNDVVSYGGFGVSAVLASLVAVEDLFSECGGECCSIA